MADAAPTADDLLTRMNAIAPPSGGQVSTSAPSSSAPSSDDLLTRMNTIAPPPAPAKAAAPSSDFAEGYGMMARPTASGADIANAFQAGTYRGLASVFNAPSAWFGLNPLFDTEGDLLTPGEKQAAQAVPGTAAAGQLFGQMVGTSPLALAAAPAEAAFAGGALGGAGWVPTLARGALTGAGLGAAQGVMTAGEDPQQSLLTRARIGAEWGAPLGLLGGAAGKALGGEAGAAVSGEAEGAVPAADLAWVGDAKQRVDQLLQENAALGGPDSLSAAATPPDQATLTPAQVKAYRRVSEINQIASPITGEDNTNYVEGSIPTQAERMGDPVTSQQETLTRQRAPDQFEGPNGRLTQNNAARIKAFDDTNIGDVRAAELQADQQAAAERDGAQFLRQSGPVDATAPAAWAKTQLANPRIQENPEVYNTIKDLNDRLYDADGNLKTDPEAFWGMHDRLQNMLQKAKDPLNASSNEKFAVTQINNFKQLVDGAMDNASNGAWRNFLDNQSDFLKQRNAYNILNTFRNKGMLKSDGTINANNFHRFVTDLAIRRGKPGVDAAMDVPDDTMQRLINIDSDLKRASRIDLGKARGSPTNLFYTLGRAMGIGGAHLGAHVLGAGPLGQFAVRQGTEFVERKLGEMRLNRLVKNALAMPPGGLTPPPGNPLSAP